jgi:hypothetical protein
MSKSRLLLLGASVAGGSWLATSCKEPTACSEPFAVSVEPDPIELVTGQSAQMKIASLSCGKSPESVDTWRWRSSDVRAATVDSITGILLALDTTSTLIVTATGTRTRMSGEAHVKVDFTPCNSPSFPAIPLLDTVSVGDTVRFRLPAAALMHTPARRIFWSSGNPAIATITSDSGLATAQAKGATDLIGEDVNNLRECHEWRGTLVVR